MRPTVVIIENHKFDFCRIGNGSGAIETCYPFTQWEKIELWSDCYHPDAVLKSKTAIPANTEVIAYGGDGLWLALKRKEQ